MSEYESPVQVDPSTEDYGMEEFQALKDVSGVITYANLGDENDEGYQQLTVAIEHPEDSPDKTTISSSIRVHKDRMRKGRDNSDLPAGHQTGLTINKRRLNDLGMAADVSIGQILSTPEILQGRRVKFSAKARKDDPSRPEYTGFKRPNQ